MSMYHKVIVYGVLYCDDDIHLVPRHMNLITLGIF
jgi:hypothetical protein